MRNDKIFDQFQIEHKDKRPIYIQLYSFLLDQIRGGMLKEGEQLINEVEIADRLKISRTSVRLALQKLESENRIIRERGRGTFVAKRLIVEEKFTQIVIGAVDELRELGIPIEVKILKDQVMKTPFNVRSKLRIAYNKKVRFIERLLLTNSRPLYVSQSYLPVDYFGQFDKRLLLQKSLTNTIQEQNEMKLKERESTVYPDIPDRHISDLLNIKNAEDRIVQICEVVSICVNRNHAKGRYLTIAYYNAKAGVFVFKTRFH